MQGGQVAQNAVENNDFGVDAHLMSGAASLQTDMHNKGKSPKEIQQATTDYLTAKGFRDPANDYIGYMVYGSAAIAGTLLAPELFVAYRTMSPIVQSAVKSGVVGSSFDAANQIYTCPTCSFNYQRNIGVGFTSFATGLYGAGLASSAGVTQVGFLNLPTNLRNVGGLVIFGNQQILNQAGGNVVKNATSNEKKSEGK